MAPINLAPHLAVESIGPDQYVSGRLMQRVGNTAPIAYGGHTLGIAVFAAHQSVGKGFAMFSVLGSFLGPTRTDRKLYCRVFRTRDTRTFATRRVVAYQVQDDQSERNCAELAIDFHVQEQGMFEYSAEPPSLYFGNPEDPAKTASNSEIANHLLQKGEVSQKDVDSWTKAFAMMNDYFDVRPCLQGVSGQNLNGLAKKVATTHDHLPITQRSCAEWFRARHSMDNAAEHAAVMSFWLDGALSFLPLNLEHMDTFDAGACSTLDFALRVFIPELAIDSWHLRERKTIAAHAGRTYSESRVWNLSGQMVAIMTQTSICRPLAKAQVNKANL